MSYVQQLRAKCVGLRSALTDVEPREARRKRGRGFTRSLHQNLDLKMLPEMSMPHGVEVAPTVTATMLRGVV